MIHVVHAITHPTKASARTQLEPNAANLPHLGIWESPQPDIAPLHVFSDQADLVDELKRAGWLRTADPDGGA